MEIHIQREKYIGKDNKDYVIEPVAKVPYANGIHKVEGVGEVGVKISKFRKENGATKVLFVSEALSTKKSAERRVVGFPQDIGTTVSQEVSPTEKLVFKRVK